MNSIIKRWVEKLRSGEYQQGMGFLNKDGKFCCLGVLCEVAVEDGITFRDHYRDEFQTITYENSISTSILPVKVEEWAELRKKQYFQEDLMHANDTLGKTFNQIADMIEEEYDQTN